MRRIVFVLITIILPLSILAQSEVEEETSDVWDRLYFNWFDVGVIVPYSESLESTFIFKSAIEYRFQKKKGFFLRLNTDNYSPTYQLSLTDPETNVIEGDVRVQEWLLGPGYRVGEGAFRASIAVLPGLRMYNFPEFSVQDQTIQIKDKSMRLWTTSVVVSGEYYLNDNVAFSLSLLNNQALQAETFWIDGQSAIGLSLGLTSSF